MTEAIHGIPDRCPAIHPDDGSRCYLPEGHHGPHALLMQVDVSPRQDLHRFNDRIDSAILQYLRRHGPCTIKSLAEHASTCRERNGGLCDCEPLLYLGPMHDPRRYGIDDDGNLIDAAIVN